MYTACTLHVHVDRVPNHESLILQNWIGNRQRRERQVFTKAVAKPRKPKVPRTPKTPATPTVAAGPATCTPSTSVGTGTNATPTFTTADLVSTVPQQLALLDSIAALGGDGGGANGGEDFLSPTAEEMPTVTVVNMNSNEEQIKGLMRQIQELVGVVYDLWYM